MKPGSIYRLIQELKRRRVFRGILVYGASTLLILEAADIIANAFGIEGAPDWIVVVLAFGFLGSLVFSWIYDITPGGIKRTEPEVDHKVPIPKKEVRIYQTTTFVSVLIIIGLVSFRLIDNAKAKQMHELDKSIAVLPMNVENLSQVQRSEYSFIGQEITSCLTRIKHYKVIPWENTRYYQKEGKSNQRMGKELDAAILVDWEKYDIGSNQYINVNLISTVDGDLLWSKNIKIKGEWSSEICKHSRRISKMITRELRIYLTPKEKELVDELPGSTRAFMFGFMGRTMAEESWTSYSTGGEPIDTIENEYTDSLSFALSINYFTQAIEEDPTYAEAYAHRAKAKLWGIRAQFFNQEIMDECISDISQARKLQPDLPEADVAMGFYCIYELEDLLRAEELFKKASEQRPESTEYLFYLSVISRTLGKWDKVRLLSDKVYESNSHNVLFLTNLGISYLFLGDPYRATTCLQKAMMLKPDWYVPYIHFKYVLTSSGDIEYAIEMIRQAEMITGMDLSRTLAELELLNGNYPDAVELIELAGKKEYHSLSESEGDALLLKAKIHKHAGELKRAVDYYEQAEQYFTNRILFNPDDYFAHSKLGIACAATGKISRARDQAEMALSYIDPLVDAVDDPSVLYNTLLTYTLAGLYDEATGMMKKLLAIHSDYTLTSLKLDPDLRLLFDYSDPESFIN